MQIKNKKQKFKTGFTIIELLIVIVIIGILASIGIASMKEYEYKTRIIKAVQELRLIEKFFLYEVVGDGLNEYRTETSFGAGVNPTLSQIIQNYPGAEEYFGEAFQPSIGTGEYRYDNDDDIYTCSSGSSSGVQIYIRGIERFEAESIQEIFENDNDLDCGKVIFNSYYNQLHFQLSKNGDI